MGQAMAFPFPGQATTFFPTTGLRPGGRFPAIHRPQERTPHPSLEWGNVASQTILSNLPHHTSFQGIGRDPSVASELHEKVKPLFLAADDDPNNQGTNVGVDFGNKITSPAADDAPGCLSSIAGN